MTAKNEDVWTERDYPVLLEVARLVDQGENSISAETIGETLGMDPATVGLAYDALVRRGLIEGSGTAEHRSLMWAHDITGDAYLMTGLHPSGDDALSSLIDALRQAADLEPDPDEKSRLRRAADSLGGISRSVAVGVMTAWATKQLGG